MNVTMNECGYGNAAKSRVVMVVGWVTVQSNGNSRDDGVQDDDTDERAEDEDDDALAEDDVGMNDGIVVDDIDGGVVEAEVVADRR
jgi:hypothetical protein